MTVAITAIGFLICIASLFAALSPRRLTRLLEGLQVSTPLRVFAAVVRIVIGTLLVLAAPLTGYATALEVLGVLLVAVGIVLLFLKNSMVQTLVDLATGIDPFAIRTGGVFGLLFGGFIVYAGA